MERSIGRVEGILKGMDDKLCSHGKMLGRMDKRLRGVEKQSAKYGAVSGGLMATVILVGSAFIKESIKKKFGM